MKGIAVGRRNDTIRGIAATVMHINIFLAAYRAMRGIRFAMLFLAALLGTASYAYIETDIIWPAHPPGVDIFPSPECSDCLAHSGRFLHAVVSTFLAAITAKLVRLPDLLVPAAAVSAPLVYYPAVAVFRYGESLSFIAFPHTFQFWIPYVLGSLSVIGAVHLISQLKPRQSRQSDRPKNGEE